MQLKGENQIPRPLKFPKEVSSIADGWAIRNIKDFNNSVLPNDLIEALRDGEAVEVGIRRTKKLIEAALEEKIEIYRTSYGYKAERYL